MKRSDQFDKDWLFHFGKELAQSLTRTISDSAVKLFKKEQLKPWDTDTGGWAMSLGKLSGDRSNEFQVWFDHYPNVGRRVVSVCYMATKRDRIAAVASAGAGELGDPIKLGDEIMGSKGQDEIVKMIKPLSPGRFNKPIAELYNHNPCSFFGVYLSASINVKKAAPAELVRTGARFLCSVIRSAAVVHLPSPEDFPDIKNRSAVRRHKLHERPASKWTEVAKRRDSFTCQVCRISFVELYGELGRGFAEAHHIIPLSSLRARAVTKLSDLITVCANCHRMLHRSVATDVRRLKRLFTWNWPER
ncbi:MAG: HNH endonuclease [Chthoniobacteraceae bacterium]